MRFGHVRWADLPPWATRLQSSSDDDASSGCQPWPKCGLIWSRGTRSKRSKSTTCGYRGQRRSQKDRNDNESVCVETRDQAYTGPIRGQDLSWGEQMQPRRRGTRCRSV